MGDEGQRTDGSDLRVITGGAGSDRDAPRERPPYLVDDRITIAHAGDLDAWVVKHVEAPMRVTLEGRSHLDGRLLRVASRSFELPTGDEVEVKVWVPWDAPDRFQATGEDEIGPVEVVAHEWRDVTEVLEVDSIDVVDRWDEESMLDDAHARVHEVLSKALPLVKAHRMLVTADGERRLDHRIVYSRALNGETRPVITLRQGLLAVEPWATDGAPGGWRSWLTEQVVREDEFTTSRSGRTVVVRNSVAARDARRMLECLSPSLDVD